MKNKAFHNRSKLTINHGNMSVELPSTTNGNTKNGNNPGYTGKSITETIINGFFTVDRRWTVQYWNEAAEKLLGVKAKDIVGKNIWKKFAAVIPVEFYKIYDKAFLQVTPVHFKEYWGEMGAWFDVISYRCDDELSVSFKSSTQSVQPDDPQHPVQRIQIVNELYQFVTEVTNDCLWEWDLHTREIFWIDGGHKRVFGYPIENALIPQSFWESCLHPDDKNRIVAGLNRIIEQGSVTIWEDEYRFKRSDGNYAWVHDRGHIVYDGKKALRMIGATQDITYRVLLQDKLIDERLTRQRELTAAIFTAQEKERAEIGRELHDNLGQVLAATKMYMQMAREGSTDKGEYISKSCDFIDDVIIKIRSIAKNLVIPGIHIIGLLDNIKNLIGDLEKIHNVKIEFYSDGINEKEMDENFRVNIFRIVQEQLNNILKHANATLASIHLTRQANNISLLISDNGKGCDISKENGGVGIINIRSRAELLHGKVTIVTKPGKGYKLKVELPVQGLTNKTKLVAIPE